MQLAPIVPYIGSSPAAIRPTRAYIGSDIVSLMSIANRTGALVRARREAHGLSQARLALRAGTTQAGVSRVERGEVSPSIATLERLLWAMGEELELSARPAPAEWDEDHHRDVLRRPAAERLALALTWNRLAGQLAAAGRRARGGAS